MPNQLRWRGQILNEEKLVSGLPAFLLLFPGLVQGWARLAGLLKQFSRALNSWHIYYAFQEQPTAI